ncbi:hypothetical protein C9374_002230 [Naegleria lovaniensis]|uniref:SAM domain-containing protein n=1 Tax=Naegleria lovaniensis TaxID=51637 RepID=A0AA88KMG8_NAELO|nr:uncharacterized protein C9374_002230 [Naegleria lovaniensis]KAG2386486.1 hypothetical protein C9374_002230 [Naegleria lovaniensis]
MSFLKRIFKTKSKGVRSQFSDYDCDPTIIPIKDWDVVLFSVWLRSIEGVSDTTIEKLKEEEWDGKSLLYFSKNDLTSLKIPLNEATLIEQHLDQLKLDQHYQMRSFNQALASSDSASDFVLSSQTSLSDHRHSQKHISLSSSSKKQGNANNLFSSLNECEVIGDLLQCEDGSDERSILMGADFKNRCILSKNESSFESLNEGYFVQSHRPEIFTDDESYSLRVFRLALRRLEQAFPLISARSRSLADSTNNTVGCRASNNYGFSSLPPQNTRNITSGGVLDEMMVVLPQSVSQLTSLEKLCLSNCMKKVKSCPDMSAHEKRLLAHTLSLVDCFMYCYFFNYQTVLSSVEKNALMKRSPMSSHHSEEANEDVEKRFVQALKDISENLSALGVFGNSHAPNNSSTGGSSSSHNNSSTNLLGEGMSPTASFGKTQKLFRSLSIDHSTKPYLLIQLVIFPFERSHVFDMKSDSRLRPYTLFRTGLLIGDWFLEWGENSLVYPSISCKYRVSPQCHLIQLMKIEGEKNITRLLRKIAQICVLWNGTQIFNLQTCNHQHFVNDILTFTGLFSNTKQLGSVSKFLDRIEQLGFSDMRLVFNSQFFQKEFPNNEFISFHSHADVDGFYLKVDSMDPNYFHDDMDGKHDKFLLRLFDRSFYYRKEMGMRDKSDLALNEGDYCNLCPFNIDGLSLKELEEREVQELMKNQKTAHKAYLGSYEPINPAAERDWKY